MVLSNIYPSTHSNNSYIKAVEAYFAKFENPYALYIIIVCAYSIIHIIRGNMEKQEVLSSIGAINKSPEKVTNRLFLSNDFFDPLDNVQVKYEMLRSNQVEKHKVTHVCNQYCYSREAFYVILRKFKSKGIAGLVEGVRKKKNTIMLNESIINTIIQVKFHDPDISGAKLAEKINVKFRTDYKKRAIEKAVKALGLTKKK